MRGACQTVDVVKGSRTIWHHLAWTARSTLGHPPTWTAESARHSQTTQTQPDHSDPVMTQFDHSVPVMTQFDHADPVMTQLDHSDTARPFRHSQTMQIQQIIQI